MPSRCPPDNVVAVPQTVCITMHGILRGAAEHLAQLRRCDRLKRERPLSDGGSRRRRLSSAKA
ncbi:MAG: hypothetical protein ACLRVN_07245 [Butyricicoccus sp.]